MCYDYKAGKERIKEILDNKLEIKTGTSIPKDNNFTYDNAYKGYVTALFVDIRNSTKLFSNENKTIVSKIIRSFTSEIIEILRNDDNIRELGIRGDCVYAIYTSNYKENIDTIYIYASYINCCLFMLNKLFSQKGYPTIEAGIGISTAEELVVKAGRYGTGINNLVWIGEAVTLAAKFSSMANKNSYNHLIISSLTYNNIKEDYQNLMTEKYDYDLGMYVYHGSPVNVGFEKWINEGMPK